MIRAGVFIGVDKTGGLQKLHDAADGARRMYEWALAQGITDQTHAKLITDVDGSKVDPDQIYDAIKEIIDGAGADQLIVYFAGHGVNISRSEQWLLTDAPVRTSAAVNVSGSVELARYCGIQHVVIISDACRVAPEGIQAQTVRGIDIFPNDGAGDRARPVDQFFACYLGRTAAEIKDPAVAASTYSALYTSALLDALKGSSVDALEPSDVVGENCHYVRPRKLEAYLEREIPSRVKKLKLLGKVNQNPDAIITSDGSWLSRIDVPIAQRRARPTAVPSTDLRSISQQLVRAAVAGGPSELTTEIEQVRSASTAGGEQLVGSVEAIATPFGPDHFETECGIKVRGAHIVDFYAPRVQGELLGSRRENLRISHVEYPAASVLLRFDGDMGTVVPALPGFIAALTFDEGELVDVAYEPSANPNNWRWQLYAERATELRALRAVAATASQHGRFRLEGPDAIEIAQKMQYAKGIDPTLAVYAAYAYHDLQAIERIDEMSGYLRGDLGAIFFDLALLGRKLINRAIGPDDGIVPFVPLLSQGWALLGAHRIRLHPALWGIERTMRDSLWSLFDLAGVQQLQHAMRAGDVR
jgi:hypothetical protein